MAVRGILLSICLLAASASSTAAEERAGRTTGSKGPVKVFLLMGQSNMNGRGNIEVLKNTLTKDLPDEYPPSLVEMRDDVWITGANEDPVYEAAVQRRAGKPPMKTAGGNNIR